MFENNKISKLLNVRYPIIQGGMAWASDSRLACSVSNAGGFGIIGCAGRDKYWVLDQIEHSKNNTSNAVGLNVALADKNAVSIVEIAIENDIKVFTMGGANTYLKLLSKYGKKVLIIPLVGSVIEAKIAQRAGAKAVICEGQESGGSIGRLSLFSLLPQVADSVSIPVIAAGGIADSRGMRAAFALGAEGIQMGTRFLASDECKVIDEYKNKIIKAKDTDSMVISRRLKRPTRVIKNKFSLEYISKEKSDIDEIELRRFVRGKLKLAVESDVDSGAMHAGEISGLITNIKSTQDIIDEIISGFSIHNQVVFREKRPYDSKISKYLKHKPPILFLQKILDLKPGIKCKAFLKLDKNDWFFKCHYPEYPVMPGALLIEAMSQVLVLTITSKEENIEKQGQGVLLSEVSNARFIKEVLPDTELVIESKVMSSKRGVVSGYIQCKSEGEIVCTSDQTILIPNIMYKFIKPKQ